VRISLRWLEDYVDVDVPVSTLVERLDLTGTKVEAVHDQGRAVRGVVVAEVVSIEEHPAADNLILVDVTRGDGTTQRVVCGARNFSVGDRVPLATVGARLGTIEIARRKIRGQESNGMLCSAAELGVSSDHSGILVLPFDAPVDADVSQVLALDDTVLELELTPNRPDCMSMIGVAREVAAILGTSLRTPVDDVVTSDDVPTRVSVDVEDERGCPRYLALELEGATTGPSPTWIAHRLLAAGFRPISNIVDVTNYVLVETGQPLHAFDATKIADRKIVVRRARPAETLVTLDGVERRLHGEDLVIADPAGAIALAGVMGGAGSEVSGSTTEVVLEAAYFDPGVVSFTARRHLLRTEASARFERGMDPNAVGYAARRAAKLMAEVAGARVGAQAVDVYPSPIAPRTLRLRAARTSAVLGADMSAADQRTALESLQLDAAVEGDTLSVTVPTFRPDLTREIDLVEEVGRLSGYERLPSTLPAGPKGGLTPAQAAERSVRSTLAGFGLTEVWTSSFTSEANLDGLGLPLDHPGRAWVELENPTAQQHSALRTTLLSGLLGAAAHNLRQRVEGVALFEMARVYVPTGDQLPDERATLAALFAGRRSSQAWNAPERTWNFFAAKGILEALVRALGVPRPGFAAIEEPPWHPTRAAAVLLGGERIGALGELHPDVCDRLEVAPRTVAFELALTPVFDARPGPVRVGALPRFPAVLVDVALVVENAVPAQRVEDVIRKAGAPEVTSVRLFDVYRGDQVEPDRKSLAFALELRSPDRTLTDVEANEVRDRIVAAARSDLGAELRG
jgi:phenylalanyl-tRNA synthetase beta chain